MTKYKIELNEEQVNTLIKALDLYSRIGLGQFHEILDWQFNWNKNISYENDNYICEQLDLIKFILTDFSSNEYRGICSPDTPERCKVAFDIQQVVRYCQAWHNNPKGDITVNYDEPMVCSNQPLPKCSVE